MSLFVGNDLHPLSYDDEGFQVPEQRLETVDGPQKVGCAPHARPRLQHHIFHDGLHSRQQVLMHTPDRALEECREALDRRHVREFLLEFVRGRDDVVEESRVDALVKFVSRCR